MVGSDLFLVNATNVLLGLVTVGCWLAVLTAVGLELRGRFRHRLL
jgi:hypothetical protein